MLTSPSARKKALEYGQILPMALMLLALLLGFAAIVVDVGFFLHRREKVQAITDAAALAGAQELPDDPIAAEDAAREWADRNGIDGDSIDVSFECRRGCDPGLYDTIVVTGSMRAPATFMRVLRLLGAGGSCWTDGGCDVEATAAAEARTAEKPIDVMLILDRTGSMSDGDMDNAKDGARDLLTQLNPDLVRVGLGVLGPSESLADPCDSALPGVWQPVDLSDDYQRSNGSLNPSSRLVSTINCLDNSGGIGAGTNLGDPLRAVREHLLAAGNPEADKAIILLTDGAANVGNQSTGFRNCAAQTAVPNPGNGDGNGYESSPANACGNGSLYASDVNSGTNSSTSCSSSGKDRHRFYNYGISLPGSATINGIEVRLDAAVDSSIGNSRLCVELSWNGGASWTSARTTRELISSWDEYHLGGTDERWGRSWTASNLANGNFMVRVTDISDSILGTRDFFLEWVSVNVYYSSGSGGPCTFAAREGDFAKIQIPDVKIYTIGYGVAGSRCSEDTGPNCNVPSGFWRNCRTDQLLTYIASEPGNYFDADRGDDLSPIFREIGRRLAAGYRLVD